LRALVANVLGAEKPLSEMQFNLENGLEQLGQVFAWVERFDFEDALVVTETEPLVAYLRSGVMSVHLNDSVSANRLRQIITDHIAHDGAFCITKSTGLFVATG